MELQNFSIANQSSTSQDEICDRPKIAEIQSWMISYLARMLEVDPEEIDTATPFDRYGLDSSAVVGMTGDLEDWLNVELDPTIVYDYPTIETLTQYLATEF